MTRTPKAPRVPEKVVQTHVVALLRNVGGTVLTLGTVRAKGDRPGTMQSHGWPDVGAFLPESPLLRPAPLERWADGTPVMVSTPAHFLWVEVKAQGGTLRKEQAAFRELCLARGIPHIVGGLDEVLAYLAEHGYVKETAYYRKRSA